MKEKCPVILPPDTKGNTEINPVFVSYMQYVAFGNYYGEMGLTRRESHKIQQHIIANGVDFPSSSDWFATRTQRTLLHAIDKGSHTYPQLIENTGLDYSSIRVHVKNMRKKGIEVSLKRANEKEPQNNQEGK